MKRAIRIVEMRSLHELHVTTAFDLEDSVPHGPGAGTPEGLSGHAADAIADEEARA